MISQIQAMRSLMQARLPRRIVLWVFLSILLIEVMILLPSIYRRQQELLLNLKKLAATQVEGGLLASPAQSDAALLNQIQALSGAGVKGATLYRESGERVGSFGEAPTLSVQSVQHNRQANRTDLLGVNYDAAWSIPSLAGRYIVIARHDMTDIQRELCLFTGQMALLILLASMFVTLVTLIGLDRLLITPILRLRNDLLKVGSAVQQNAAAAEFETLKLHRDDELGEVIAAFDQMYQQVSDAISERKQAEKTLERLAEIGELAAMIVHEVRNPLTTVIMGLQSFQTMELSQRYQLRLNLALEEAERLQRLLNEILQYARCQKIDAVELEINALIQNLLETLQTMPTAQGRQIQFTPAPPVRVLGDPDKLKQVFINLVSNACEAVEAGETIWWSLESCNHQRTVCIRIKNGGKPIPGDVLPRLTKPFVTTKPSGNGLGLAIVKRIVEAHRGELKLDSSEALGGTEVTIVLPFLAS